MARHRKRKWNERDLQIAAKNSTSIRQILNKIGLVEAGGNYAQIKKYLHTYKIDTSHFRGQAWNKGMRDIGKPRLSLEKILVENSFYQNYKLKKRLFKAGIKSPHCEMCGWSSTSKDGRLPLELDHVNGNSKDNRLSNLRVLCPNCHSLQPTHRGKNRKKGQWRNWYTRNT